MSMIAEKWAPVFGNDHAQTKEKGGSVMQLKPQAR